MYKAIISFFLIGIFTSGIVQSDDGVVISLGQDLTMEQRNQIIELFGADKDTKALVVTNEEERKYLGNFIDENLIGTRALSCAYVEIQEKGEGIEVEIYNITWVTKEMYMNALATAGVENARVKVAAPVDVSGTAALTGIIKAFEGATGKNIGERQKEIANEEIAKTGSLGQEIGKEDASQLIKEIKEEIISRDIKSEKDIREIVIKISGDLNINLNDKQVNEIVELMKNIANLNLDFEQIKGQLKGIADKINEISEDNKEVKSLLQRILDFIRELFAQITTWFTRK